MKLKEYRIKNNYTQSELAKILGISQRSVSNYESGASDPDIETLIKMSRTFGTSIDNLVGNVRNESYIDLSIYSKKKQLLIKEVINAFDDELENLFEEYIERAVRKDNEFPETKLYKQLSQEEHEKNLQRMNEIQQYLLLKEQEKDKK